MNRKAEIKIFPASVIWIRKNNEMVAVSQKSQVMKIFSDKKSEVREYMNKYRTEIENPDHLKSLVTYYNGLSL